MIHTCNWILTRRCNLKCSYCRIYKDYTNYPLEYPHVKELIENEMSTDFVIEALTILKKYNPNIFHCFYGGEPFLRDDLGTIINFCNNENIEYTITSNGTLPKKIDKFLKVVNYNVKGLSFSIDPEGNTNNISGNKKSNLGLKHITNFAKLGIIKDLCADLVITSNNILNLYKTLKNLSNLGSNTNINTYSPAKNNYYDLSNSNDSYLIQKNRITKEIFNTINNDPDIKYLFKPMYLEWIYERLPSNIDCEIEKDFHNMTIDADGSVRLCGMIRGVETPKYKIFDYISKQGCLDLELLLPKIKQDKVKYCSGCMWACIGMSKMVQDGLCSYQNILGDARLK